MDKFTMSDLFDPAEAKRVVENVTELRRSLLERLRLVPPAALLKKPTEEDWSAIEILRHLVFAEDLYLNRWILRNEKPWQAIGLLPPLWEDDERFVGVGTRATEDLEEILAVWSELHEDVMAYVASVTEDRLRQDTSDVDAGQGTVGAVIQQLASHDHYHIGQIGERISSPAEVGLPPGWRAAGGQWRMDGSLRILGRSRGNGYLFREEEHPDDVRVRATLQAVAGVEITMWICGSPEKVEADGYTLAVSTERAKLQRRGQDVASDPSVTIQPGRDRVMAFERRADTLRGYLDGAADPFIEWTDPEPLRGEGHRTLGFYLWDGTLAVSNVTVEDLAR